MPNAGNLRLSKWDYRFINLAKEVSTWSKDRTKVSAVLVRPDNSLVSVGFNGLVPGMNDDEYLKDRDFKNKCVRHAEENAIWFGRHEPSFEGYTIYIYGWPGPCGTCAAEIAMAKIGRVIGAFETIPNPDWIPSIKAAFTLLDVKGILHESYRKNCLCEYEEVKEFPLTF